MKLEEQWKKAQIKFCLADLDAINAEASKPKKQPSLRNEALQRKQRREAKETSSGV